MVRLTRCSRMYRKCYSKLQRTWLIGNGLLHHISALVKRQVIINCHCGNLPSGVRSWNDMTFQRCRPTRLRMRRKQDLTQDFWFFEEDRSVVQSSFTCFCRPTAIAIGKGIFTELDNTPDLAWDVKVRIPPSIFHGVKLMRGFMSEICHVVNSKQNATLVDDRLLTIFPPLQPEFSSSQEINCWKESDSENSVPFVRNAADSIAAIVETAQLEELTFLFCEEACGQC